MSIEKNNIIEKYSLLKSEAEKHLSKKYNRDNPQIYIGMSTCCRAAGSLETKAALEKILEERNVDTDIIPVGCLGHCYAEPFVIVKKPDFPSIFYYEVTPAIARLIVTSFLENDDPLFEYLRKKRTKALEKVKRGLKTKKYAKIMQNWEAFLNKAPQDSVSLKR